MPRKTFSIFFVFSSSPLCYKRDTFLEVVKVSAMCHGLEAPVNLGLPPTNTFCSPIDNVVLKDTLVQLVKEIWCKTGEDIRMGKATPKRVVRSQTLSVKFL